MTFKKKLLTLAIASAFGLSACSSDDGVDGTNGTNGVDGTNGTNGTNGADGQDLTAVPKLTRIATVPLGAEITGIFKTDDGDLFFNVQHPDDSLPGDEAKAAVGAWLDMDFDNLDPRLADLAVPASDSAEAQTTQVVAGSYQVLGRQGDTFTGQLPFGFGNIVNAAEDALIKESHNPDFNAFIPTNADSSEGYLFSAFEDRPGAMSRLQLTKQGDGSWEVGEALNVDFSAVKGTMINCFGTVSPWGTPLTSEENYEAENTKNWNNPNYASGYPSYADVQNIQTYLGGTFPNPYDYGYIVEITDPAGTATPVKHFTLGRVAHENVVIMPDQKTVYITDDGTNKGFYKFIADTAGDLSAGTLYAAKLTQDGTKDVEKAGFDISWIELGSANNTDIESWIDSYDSVGVNATYTDVITDGNTTDYISDDDVATWAAGGAADDRVAFLETLRAAEAKGATVEFRKMEGININHDAVANGTHPFMYVAMSQVASGMTDDAGDIQLNENRCGAVYRFGIQSDYNVLRMDPVVVGGEYNGNNENRCPVDGIASPDNLVVLNDGRVIIGEDTSYHVNNAMWVYNPAGE